MLYSIFTVYFPPESKHYANAFSPHKIFLPNRHNMPIYPATQILQLFPASKQNMDNS